jgi:PHD/YefM family antitoxin component YafN of YafNO toxin-antitoxin module
VNTIPAQEIKQRGISAVDELLERGPVHVISRNRPKYVILDETTYEELREAQHRAFVAEVRQALAEVEAGNVQRYDTVQDLMDAIRQAGEDE